MAAPQSKTLPTLTGKYVTNQKYSTSLSGILNLQGMSWFFRKAVCALPITLHITCYTLPNDPAPHILHIDITQAAPGGLPGTTEKRTLNWEWKSHSDYVFGEGRGRTRWVVLPGEVEKMKDETDEDIRFLVEGFLPSAASTTTTTPTPLPGNVSSGVDGGKVSKEALSLANGKYIETQVENAKGGWTAHQVWGFEEVDGQRRYVRHVVVRKGTNVERARLVYDFLGEL